jgi:branched-chain amino acid transport system substrate-binding protein
MRDPKNTSRWRTHPLFHLVLLGALLALGGGSTGCSLDQCRTTADCVAHKLPGTICTPKKYCAKVVSEDCPRLLGGEITENAQVFALMTKLTGQSSTLGESSSRAAELALSELAEWSKGVSVPGGKHPSNLRILACSDGKDDADGVRIARGLVDGLGLPVVMGPVYSGVSLAVARQVTIPGGALMLNPYAVTPLLSTLDDRGLVWRTSLSNAPEGAGMWKLVERIQKALVADGRLTAKEPLRIATVARPDVYGRGIVEPFVTESRRSPLSSIDPMTKMSQVEIHSYELVLDKDKGTYSFDAEQLTGAASGMGRLPHIVVLAGTAEMVKTVLEPLELARQRAAMPAALPIYVASEGLRLQEALEYVARQTGPSPLQTRLFIFAPTINRNLYGILTQRWETRYRTKIPDLYGVANTYDAVYLLAYSMASLSSTPVSGASLASGLRLLIPGSGRRKIQAGLLGIEPALSDILAGRGFDYDGVVGPLDFDLQTGDAPGDFDILCVRDADSFAPSGMTLKTSAGAPVLSEGYIPCP